MRPARSEEQREAEDEQEVADDAPRQRTANDVGQPLVDGEQGDDQLRRVAEGRVQEPSDPGTGVVRGVLGRFADHPGERDERECCEQEQGHVAQVEDVIREEGEWREGERAPEDVAPHAASVQA